MLKDYFVSVLGSYLIILLIAKGSIFNKYRQWLIDKTPWLQKPAMRGENPPLHYFLCRLCLGALVCAVFSYIYWTNWFIVYGISYFLATQER